MTTAGNKIVGKMSAILTQTITVQAVYDEIETGMQVRYHGRVQVNGQRQTVGAVVQQHDDVRAPATDERNEDDENCFNLPYCLHCCHITGFISLL